MSDVDEVTISQEWLSDSDGAVEVRQDERVENEELAGTDERADPAADPFDINSACAAAAYGYGSVTTQKPDPSCGSQGMTEPSIMPAVAAATAATASSLTTPS